MKSVGLLPWMLLEKMVNEVLHKDPESASRLAKLDGKVLRFDLKELPFQLTVSVTQQGLQLSTLNEESADCWIKTELGVLPELKDTANLTRLIKADQLDIEGDPVLAQNLVNLLRHLDIDWEAELARKIGDAPAHWLSQLWRRSRENFKASHDSRQRWLTGVITEEKKLLPARAEFELHKQQLQQLRADLEKLERRLAKGGMNA
ncbi:SCP2 sterol-binding domain-containing protein [Idiomarina seosinensis]|uniref:ubiquinone biosynthesis accessory factor UbiJ n=1 Tax=Idiomarina seosinensis TaxID=281739 RepID=UPI00384ACB2E